MHPARFRPMPVFPSFYRLPGSTLPLIAITLIMTFTPLAQIRETAIVVDTLRR